MQKYLSSRVLNLRILLRDIVIMCNREISGKNNYKYYNNLGKLQ